MLRTCPALNTPPPNPKQNGFQGPPALGGVQGQRPWPSPMTRPLSVALAGLGTVGGGVLRLLRDNADIVAARAGRPIAVTAVSARDRSKDRGVSLTGLRWYEDPVALAADPAVDVVVELIGGSDGPARALAEAAIAAGKPVVTANKAMLAVHGAALAALAEDRGVPLAFEAAVAGGIPVIKALREGLAGNRVSRIAGILNGTCNYILTQMRERGREFAEVLGDAQKLGYAETDPSFDVDGIDAAHKLAILAALAFGRPVAFDAVYVEGIRRISALDIAFAGELGYRIKLLGIARQTDGGIEARVHPCMVPHSAPIARVDGVFNAVVAEGDFVGRVMLEGRGAGAGPTASAVVADLIDLARGRHTPVWGAAADALSNAPSMPMSAHVGPYYLRLMVVDRPGVIADVTAVLRDLGISLESMLQRGRSPGEAVPVVLVTHETQESAMRAALEAIGSLNTVLEAPTLIRIEAG
jgi:homoserine dehydrogenase